MNERNVRALALEVLMGSLEEGKYCDRVLHRILDENKDMSRKDRAFLTRLSEGTIERKIEIDYILNQFSKVKVRKMKPVIRCILRMAVYQFLYMDQIPNRAACDEAVKLVVKRRMQGLRGFVNGVLRNIDRHIGEISYPDAKDFVKFASVKYSMPEWIIEYLLEEYSEEMLLEILASYYKEQHSTSVRCNLFLGCTENGIDTDESTCATKRTGGRLEMIRSQLEEQGITVSAGAFMPEALYLSGYDRMNCLKVFQQGLIQVQAESSMLVGRVSGIVPGQTVLDVCAAPGGKSVHAADLLQGEGIILSCDIRENKVRMIQENMQRCRVDHCALYQQDARILHEDWIDSVDVLIADLPCSGLGVMGKKCDIKYHTTQDSIADLCSLQREILEVVGRYVRPGGTMIYSTCTLGRRENQEQVDWIRKHLPFQSVSIETELPQALQGRTGKEGFVQVLPTDRTDGFFVAKFRKQDSKMNITEKRDIRSMDLQELTQFVEELGEQKFRAKQLYQWMHQKLVSDFQQMTNLSEKFRVVLAENSELHAIRVIQQQTSRDGTTKFLMELSDGNAVESVLMKYHHGNSVCISTQVGCRMGCRFCASTVGGLLRNLRTSEMLEQVYEIQRISGERVSNVILMGIGEPLDNYDNVIKFIRMISGEEGLHISQRNLTISTCGLVEQIRRLMQEDLTITLAISLHAPNDILRQEMMPVAKRYSISQIIEVCREYIAHTNRRITFEYSLIEGKNDSLEHAEELARCLRGLNCHVNLIPLNPVKGRMGERSNRKNVLDFQARLEKHHINATIRREMGSDIDAACGQLRNKSKD